MKRDNSLALLLCLLGFCGIGGLHDFYLGCYWLGIIKLLTCNFFWIGTFIDLILLATNSYYITPAQPKAQQPVQRQAPVQQAQPVYTATPTDRISEQGITWRNGTDAQIDWAENLVNRLLERAESLTSAAVKQHKIEDFEKDQIIDELEDAIVLQDDANWWIDKRDKSTKTMLLELLPEELHDIVNEL